MYAWFCIYVRLCEQIEQVGVGAVVGVNIMCVGVYAARLRVYVCTQHDATRCMCARIWLMHLLLQYQSLEFLLLQWIYIRMFALHPPPHTTPVYLSCAIRHKGRIWLSSQADALGLHTLTIGATQPDSDPRVSDAAVALHTLAISQTRPPEDEPTDAQRLLEAIHNSTSLAEKHTRIRLRLVKKTQSVVL